MSEFHVPRHLFRLALGWDTVKWILLLMRKWPTLTTPTALNISRMVLEDLCDRDLVERKGNHYTLTQEGYECVSLE